jgi:flagellar biosynthesis protein FliQ
MPIHYATTLAERALWLGLSLSAPVVGVAAVVGLVMAMFQAATQINDATLAHVPRFVAVVVALALTGSFIGRELTAFAERAFTLTF